MCGESRIRRKLRAGLWVAVYMVLFFAARYGAYRFPIGDAMGTRAYSTGRAAAFVLQAQRPVIYALAVLMGLPVFYFLLAARRIRWSGMILRGPVPALKLPGYFAFGALLNLLVFLLLLAVRLLPRFTGVPRITGGAEFLFRGNTGFCGNLRK